MKVFKVIFSYAINVEAENEDEAGSKALEIFDDIMPKTDEMNLDIKEITEN